MGPVESAGVSTGATGASTLLGVIGSQFSGSAKYNASQYQAQVAENNARISQLNKEYELAAGKTSAENQMLKTGSMISSQKAGQAASGIDVNTGSAVDVRASTAELGALDASTIMNNAMKRAFGYDVQKASFQDEAALKHQTAAYQDTATNLDIASSLISGVSSVSDKWSKFKQVGIT